MLIVKHTEKQGNPPKALIEEITRLSEEANRSGALIASGGRVLNRAQLIDNVLGTGVAVTDRTIDVHITAVRKKMGSAAGWIQTIRGIGYTFREPG